MVRKRKTITELGAEALALQRLFARQRRIMERERPGNSNTVRTTSEAIMRTKEFRLGVAEVRAGKPPRFDENFVVRGETDTNRNWNYERGRQFGLIAPRGLKLFLVGNRINPKAVTLYELSQGL
jgi:hypothetical protein